ncbi:type IV toxin-antitoxin system AbiEi family antitoxin domain-containing protein [Luteococcus sp. H138]|uniref:type IV toxin-antitoxin system AbiEi family antitoxin domain-containing protein n=1 Tax=unclassified Luteococcus TaxID=2639923 RepID=UPI00313BA60D
METFTRSELAALGISDTDIRRLVNEGRYLRIRRGDYLNASSGPLPRYEARHRILAHATWPRLHSGVLSHHSAAALHGLPLPAHELERVHVTRVGTAGGVRRPSVQVHRARLDDVEVTEVEGLPVTTLERTAADLARILTPDRGLAVVDAALRQGANPALLAEIVEAQGRMAGAPRARAVTALGDPLAESAGESRSRWFMHEFGAPVPVLQFWVLDGQGQRIGRADFAWPEWGVVGEFDGWVKYGRLLKPGQDVSEVLRDEKTREQRMRNQGWWMHRWGDPELRTPVKWSKDLQQALKSGRPH